MKTDLETIVRNPLFVQVNAGVFLRLCLAEAVSYGMPNRICALLDDVAAMLGLYEPLPGNQSGLIAGPLIQWRTHPHQPTYESVNDINAIALKQRCLIAFGGGPELHRVGTAEIIVAFGNLYLDTEMLPEAYREIFYWAATQLHVELGSGTAEQLRTEKGWPEISDDEVLLPTGRLHATYTEIATDLRRQAIAAMKGDPLSPRSALRGFGETMLRAIQRQQAAAMADGAMDVATALQKGIDNIRAMFPDLELPNQAPPAP